MTADSSEGTGAASSATARAVGCILLPIAVVLTIAYWEQVKELPWYWILAIVVGYLWLLGTLRPPEDNQREEQMRNAVAKTLSQQGNHQEALQAAEDVLESYPQNVEALYIKGLSLFHLGHTSDAESLWEQVMERDPSHWLAANNLGSVSLNRSDYLRAAKFYRIALQLRETDTTIMENLAQVFSALATTGRKLELAGNNAEALEYAEAMVAMRPEFHLAYAFRGVQYAELGEQENAARDFRKCLEIEPSYNEARRWLVSIGRTTPPAQQYAPAPQPTFSPSPSSVRTLEKDREPRGSGQDRSLIQGPFIDAARLPGKGAGWSKGTRVFGRYEVQRLVGDSARDEVGAMGTIYICRDREVDRAFDVALKIVNLGEDGMQDSESAIRDFRLETSRWINLGPHQNLVQLISVEEHAGHPVMVMECVFGVPGVGTTLRHWLNKKGVLPIELAARWMGEVSKGVEHIHNVGNLVHCDLKPENLFIDGSGHLKVSDLGIACPIGEPARGGTAPYMAPEQFETETGIDQRADIYALGVILFESLCGRRPLPPGDERIIDAAWAYYHQNVPPRRPRDLRPDLPDKLEQIIFKCLEKEPADRFENTDALRLALSMWAPELK